MVEKQGGVPDMSRLLHEKQDKRLWDTTGTIMKPCVFLTLYEQGQPLHFPGWIHQKNLFLHIESTPYFDSICEAPRMIVSALELAEEFLDCNGIVIILPKDFRGFERMRMDLIQLGFSLVLPNVFPIFKELDVCLFGLKT